jgi:hypothetical protein
MKSKRRVKQARKNLKEVIVPFNFEECWRAYIEAAEKQRPYPRERSWDQLWDYVHPAVTSRSGRRWLVSGERLDLTALHIGFYLASWGMFRGAGMLVEQNLDFFAALSERLFTLIDDNLWCLRFDQFRTDADAASKIFNEVTASLGEFLKVLQQQNVDLIIGKLLLGVWGECPARDEKFARGFEAYVNEIRQGGGNLPNGVNALNGAFLHWLATRAQDKTWNMNAYRVNGTLYPPGKVVDMAFFQYGAQQQQH